MQLLEIEILLYLCNIKEFGDKRKRERGSCIITLRLKMIMNDSSNLDFIYTFLFLK